MTTNPAARLTDNVFFFSESGFNQDPAPKRPRPSAKSGTIGNRGGGDLLRAGIHGGEEEEQPSGRWNWDDDEYLSLIFHFGIFFGTKAHGFFFTPFLREQLSALILRRAL